MKNQKQTVKVRKALRSLSLFHKLPPISSGDLNYVYLRTLCGSVGVLMREVPHGVQVDISCKGAMVFENSRELCNFCMLTYTQYM
mgnify:CR=1